jgi:hypothetical protein
MVPSSKLLPRLVVAVPSIGCRFQGFVAFSLGGIFHIEGSQVTNPSLGWVSGLGEDGGFL